MRLFRKAETRRGLLDSPSSLLELISVPSTHFSQRGKVLASTDGVLLPLTLYSYAALVFLLFVSPLVLVELDLVQSVVVVFLSLRLFSFRAGFLSSDPVVVGFHLGFMNKTSITPATSSYAFHSFL